jgi:threonine dehydratase
VPVPELAEWQAFLIELPYQHWEETNNPAYRLFLGEGRQSLPTMVAP